MTISNTVRTAGPYTGNGVTVDYPFNFKVFLDSEVVALRSDGTTETTLVLNTDYTVTLNPDQNSNPGGTVTTLGPPLSALFTLTIGSDVDALQGASLQNQGGFYPKVIENALDRAVILIQQLLSIASRTLRFPLSDTGSNTELPPKNVRANNLLGFDANGNPTAVLPAAQSATALQLLLAGTNGVLMVGNAVDKRDLASAVNPSLGAGMGGFDFALNYMANTIGWGVQTCGNSFNLLRLIPPSEWPAIANFTSTYDATAVLTTAISTYRDVFMPRGKMRVNPAVGVLLVGSMRLRGAGQNETVLEAIANGATTAQLASYTKGSIFKRAFTPGIANPRVDTVHMSDFAIVMNHPTGAVTTTDIQIGIDLRHVGRFNIERVWVGNIAPVGGPYVKADPGTFGIQGYGIVCGNIDSGNIAYCGGEVGTIRNCSVYGCFKNIVIDDLTLSPLSGAHAITIRDCDIQAGHSLIAQEQQYTTNNLWDGNVLQNVVRQPGNASATYVYRIAGYENELRAGYIEAGVTDHILRFDSASLNNRVTMRHYSATTIGIAAFSDAGRRNRVEFCLDTNTLPGGVDSKGLPWVRYDRSYLEMSIVAHWNGSAVVVDAGFGLTMTRPTAAGDYVFTFATAVLDANGYTLEVSYDTNASGHGGTHAVISHNASNVRIQFYAQNGATSTAIDPRFVFVRVKQIGG